MMYLFAYMLVLSYSKGVDGIQCGVPRLVEKGIKGWRQKRERKLRELAPKFCSHGYKPVMERLVNRVRTPSFRWQGNACTSQASMTPTPVEV